MPFANLIIAQAAGGWLAPASLTELLVAFEPALAAWQYLLMALLSGLSVWLGGAIGARISSALPRATWGTLAACLVAAVAGALGAFAFIAPSAAGSDVLTHLITFAPVAAAITAYLVASPRPA